jgi:hypothetical protein
VAAIERVFLVHDSEGLGVPSCKVSAAVNCMPELPHEDAAGSTGSRRCNVDVDGFSLQIRSLCRAYRFLMPGLQAAFTANSQQKLSLGVSGRFNRNGNDETITRFDWKAQNNAHLFG